MIRLLAALLAPLVVIAGLVLGLPSHQGEELQRVIGAQVDTTAEAPAALSGALADATRAKRTGVRTTTLRTAASTTEATPTALPLGVSMTGLSTPVVPQEKAVVVRGRVVNDSDETWTDINVYACTSGVPITSSHELDHAAEATTDDVVCGRTSVFTTIASLAPGASAAYRLKVDRDRLGIGSRAGVYWFGVQALGTSTEGRDSVADGTVRTFLPQVGESNGPRADAAFSLVLPIRARTLHTADGRLANAETWAKDLGPHGRLSNMLALAAAAPAGEATLLVDPAVIEAARQIADGNPARDLGTVTPAPTDDASAATDDEKQDAATKAAADDAEAWLRTFSDVARRLPVLGLPYGDLDVAGASHHDVRALSRARQESEAVFADLDVSATPAIVPPNGVLPAEARALADGATVIVSSAALPDTLATADPLPSAVTIGGEQVLIAGSSLTLGGPGPTDGARALALRQRLIAQGLLRSGEDATDPALVVLPYDADPGPRVTHFFDELDRSFMHMTGVSTATGDAPEIDDLVYPSGQPDREIPRSTFATADRLTELGDTLDRILPRNAGLGSTAAREALSGTSYFTRDTSLAAAGLEGTATANLDGAASWFADRLASVDVSVPRFVILGSTEGPFAMTVTNDLPRPIRLGIRATTSGGLDIRAPRTIDVPASSSRTVNLVATSTEPGVHSLVLVVTDEDGHPIRKSQDISIRSRDVGWVIWLIMGVGAALLFGAIVLRWRKRLRARGAAVAPAATPASAPGDDTTTDTDTTEAP